MRIDGERTARVREQRARRRSDHGGDRGQARKRVAQSREVARARSPERDSGGYTLDIDGTPHFRIEPPALFAREHQLGDGSVSCAGDFARAQRVGKPVPQKTASGCGRAGIEERQQGGRRLAA